MVRSREEVPVKGKGSGTAKKTKRKGPGFDISIFRSWCKDCGLCVEFCSKKVFDRDVLGSPVIARPEDCTGCQECVLHCPDFAIQVEKKRAARVEE